MDVFVGVNVETNYLLGVLLVAIVWAMIYWRNRREPTAEVVAGASFLAAIMAIFLRLICAQGYCMVNDYVTGGMIALAIASIAFLVTNR